MNDQIRLSDAERETASQALGEHYAQGRLDADEHAERHERIWSARTRGEIPPVFADLPGGSPLHPVRDDAAALAGREPTSPVRHAAAAVRAAPRPPAAAQGAAGDRAGAADRPGLAVHPDRPRRVLDLSHRSHGRCAPTSKRYSTG